MSIEGWMPLLGRRVCNLKGGEKVGQQIAMYLEGLQPSIKDRIRVQVLRTLSEAKNMALKAKMMQRKSFDSYKTTYPGAKAKAIDYGGSYEKYGSNHTSKELVQEEKAT
ncbi:hypothetical protein GH714_012873 [Hevea brasiliensis]|uniref:Uncharacterized protein n=1 Tax=Hevea brasiliensis TaxID=3981 RepID=A0A6A6LYN2_HEVBR|nr:hypothetical protein GH714_012873 [Hevea brasiliensis]